MPGIRWIEHGDKKILYIDFSNSELKEVLATIEEAKPVIAAQPPLSLLTLVNSEKTTFTPEISSAVKEFTQHNKPYIKMTAIIGMDSIQRVVYNGVILLTRRKNLEVKKSREEALEFLANQ